MPYHPHCRPRKNHSYDFIRGPQTPTTRPDTSILSPFSGFPNLRLCEALRSNPVRISVFARSPRRLPGVFREAIQDSPPSRHCEPLSPRKGVAIQDSLRKSSKLSSIHFIETRCQISWTATSTHRNEFPRGDGERGRYRTFSEKIFRGDRKGRIRKRLVILVMVFFKKPYSGIPHEYRDLSTSYNRNCTPVEVTQGGRG